MKPDLNNLMEFDTRFLLDNILDGLKDESLIVWYALDTHSGERVWILGRKVDREARVLPCAILGSSSKALVERYAPAKDLNNFDLSRTNPFNQGEGNLASPS